jgi:pimeloyl-ACP methyl ester carboxylesterase
MKVEPEPKTVRLRLRNVALAIVGALLVVVAVPLLVLWALGPGTTAPFVDARGNTLSGSIAEQTDVPLGGLPQFVLMRGRDTANPVLLLLHGGPSDPQAPQSGDYNAALEDHFIVVNWDQRGAGRSYSDSSPEETMTI